MFDRVSTASSGPSMSVPDVSACRRCCGISARCRADSVVFSRTLVVSHLASHVSAIDQDRSSAHWGKRESKPASPFTKIDCRLRTHVESIPARATTEPHSVAGACAALRDCRRFGYATTIDRAPCLVRESKLHRRRRAKLPSNWCGLRVAPNGAGWT